VALWRDDQGEAPDRKDARNIAQLMRLRWYRPGRCNSQEAREHPTPFAGRKMLHSRYSDLEMHLRRLLQGYGLKVGPINRMNFAERARQD
jgi:transposase